MKMLTLLIPTANRPRLLRAALASVCGQTAIGQIQQIIVSENGGNQESRTVCEGFPALPIKYLFQDPPITPLDNHRLLLRANYGSDYVAILHDDDSWYPWHLQAGLADLECHPDAALYSCRYIHWNETYGFASQHLSPTHSLLPWPASLGSACEGSIKWNAVHTLALCGLLTPIHLSTTIWRHNALSGAVRILEHDLLFDNDRAITAAAALEGAVLFNPQPNVLALVHPGQHSQRESSRVIREQTAKTTQVIFNLAAGAGHDLPRLVSDLLEQYPTWALSNVLAEISPAAVEALHAVDTHRALKEFQVLYRRLQRNRSVGRWIPPILAEAIHRFRMRNSNKGKQT